MSEEQLELLEDDSTAEEQAEARKSGWKPIEDWKGDTTKWKPAKAFLSYANEALPILREQNKALHLSVQQHNEAISDLRRQLAAGKKIQDDLLEHHEEELKKQVKQAKAELASQLKQAREAGDTDMEVQILGEIQELKAPPAMRKEEAKPSGNDTLMATPAYLAWVAKNADWFEKDTRKTKWAVITGQEIQQGRQSQGLPLLQGDAFYRALDAALEEEFGEPAGDGKVAGSAGAGAESRGGKGGGKKGFSALPADAKAACHADNRNFVGKGKRFEAQKDWEEHYAKIYWSEE